MSIYDRVPWTAIQYDKPVQDQLAVLSLFDAITDEEIELLTHDVKSRRVGILLEYLGPVRLQKFLPQFLEFLQDYNWPSARGTDNMLCAAKEMLIPEIRRVFQEERDAIWNYYIILAIISHWEPALVKQLKPELLYLIQNPDAEGGAIEALAVLFRNQLLTKAELINLHQQLRAAYQNWGGDPSQQRILLKELDEVLAAV